MSAKHILLYFSVAFILTSCGPKPPKASFIATNKKGGLVQFTNTSVGVVDEFIWVFGDGDSSFAVSPEHRYNAAGIYPVKLIAKNEGGKDEATENVEISEGEKENLVGHPVFEDGDAYLIAQNLYFFSPDSPFVHYDVHGAAFAGFFDSTNFYTDVGVVSSNGERLEQKDNNTYIFRSHDSSYYFKEDPNWRVDGGGEYPILITTIDLDFVMMSAIQEAPVMDRGIDFDLSLTGPVTDADSIMFQVWDTAGNILINRVQSPNFAAYRFTPADMVGLNAGDGVVRILAYKYDTLRVNEKKLYFINESVVEADVEIK